MAMQRELRLRYPTSPAANVPGNRRGTKSRGRGCLAIRVAECKAIFPVQRFLLIWQRSGRPNPVVHGTCYTGLWGVMSAVVVAPGLPRGDLRDAGSDAAIDAHDAGLRHCETDTGPTPGLADGMAGYLSKSGAAQAQALVDCFADPRSIAMTADPYAEPCGRPHLRSGLQAK